MPVPYIKPTTYLTALWLVAGSITVSCQRRSEPPPREHTLVYGGDVFLGRGFNEALYDPKQKTQMLGDTAPFFRKADIALINGEGVVASGGHIFDKGEPRPFLFRAHRSAIAVLKGAGIDVVSVGNNHSCDYGTDALREMMQRLRKAGMDYVGGGTDLIDARTPAFRKVGDAVVAIVGADFTHTGLCHAREKRPGVLFYKLDGTKQTEDEVVKDLKGVVQKARRFADLVFLTPHWGDNGKTAPTEQTRRLARRLIGAGIDAILGHSAHRFQGVEIIDGKPVIYDAGNLLHDVGSGRGMIWEMTFDVRGATSLRGRPILLSRNRTSLARQASGHDILSTLRARSTSLGTTLLVKDGVAEISCRPGNPPVRKQRPPPPQRSVPGDVREAPNDLVRNALPHDVTPTEVTYPNGISLVGYKLFTDELFVPKAGQVVELFFKTDRPLTGNVRVHLEATRRDNGAKNVDRHIPGDWLLPVSQWPVGKFITDRKLFRLSFRPEGTVDFSMALFDEIFLAPSVSPLPLVDNTRVHLGSATYGEGAKRIYFYLSRIVQSRMAHLRDGRFP